MYRLRPHCVCPFFFGFAPSAARLRSTWARRGRGHGLSSAFKWSVRMRVYPSAYASPNALRTNTPLSRCHVARAVTVMTRASSVLPIMTGRCKCITHTRELAHTRTRGTHNMTASHGHKTRATRSAHPSICILIRLCGGSDTPTYRSARKYTMPLAARGNASSLG